MTGILTKDRKKDARISAENVYEERKRNLSYLYLCHLEEAKKMDESLLERASID